MTSTLNNAGAARPQPVSPRRWTHAEVRAEWPETNQPCELWEGELVKSPSPSFLHQKIAFRLQRALNDWVEAHDLGEVVGAPIDMVLSERLVTQPDVAFISKQRLQIIKSEIMGPADLVAEVISLGSRSRDRIEKRDLYEQYGVKEYWILDPEPQTVDVLRLEAGRYELLMRCGPGQDAKSHLLPGFVVPIDPLFAAVRSP